MVDTTRVFLCSSSNIGYFDNIKKYDSNNLMEGLKKYMEDKLIKIVTDNDIGIDGILSNNFSSIRYGVRGIIFNDNGEIAVFNKKNKNEFKLPGGGIEEDEIPEEAFTRECLEETGCQIQIDEKLGIIVKKKV